jgi:hypothetical protein
VRQVCGRRHICAVGPSKETGLFSGYVEGDRFVQWVCVRRQVCAVGVLK